MQQYLYAVLPLLVVMAGFGGSAFTQTNVDDREWVKSVPRAPWTPPSIVFSIVWGVLYVILGVLLAHMINTQAYKSRRGVASLSLLVLLCLCVLAWPFVYFKGRSQIGGVALLGVILALAAAVCVLGGLSSQWLIVGGMGCLLLWGAFALSLGVYPFVQQQKGRPANHIAP